MADKLLVRWIAIRDAKKFVAAHHRHHRPDKGGIVALGCFRGIELVGVAVIGRPKARELDKGEIAEVTRVAVARTADGGGRERGVPNVCSMLYAHARRLCACLGFPRVITYTLAEESGVSLKGAGWTPREELTQGGAWNCPSRPRRDEHPTQQKIRWEARTGAPEVLA